MIQIISTDTVKLTNSGVTIPKFQYEELNELLVDGWFSMALRFVQAALEAYRGMKELGDTSDAFNTNNASLYSATHYSVAIQSHIQALVSASTYAAMRDAIGDSIGYDRLSGIATLTWEMEYDMVDDTFYHDMLECAYWIH